MATPNPTHCIIITDEDGMHDVLTFTNQTLIDWLHEPVTHAPGESGTFIPVPGIPGLSWIAADTDPHEEKVLILAAYAPDCAQPHPDLTEVDPADWDRVLRDIPEAHRTTVAIADYDPDGGE